MSEELKKLIDKCSRRGTTISIDNDTTSALIDAINYLKEENVTLKSGIEGALETLKDVRNQITWSADISKAPKDDHVPFLVKIKHDDHEEVVIQVSRFEDTMYPDYALGLCSYDDGIADEQILSWMLVQGHDYDKK